MARVRVRADGGIARFMPEGRHEIELEVADGETLKSLLLRLGVPPSSVQVMTVNRESAPLGRMLADGDVVALMPMIVGG